MPPATAKWDTTSQSIAFNDILESVTSAGMCIYQCTMTELWAGLYEPSIYDADTLWSKDHDSGKIARVIDAWEGGKALSPIFLAKHLKHEQAVVADGKHRLTVSRAIGAMYVPFMVSAKDSEWVARTFPNAVLLHSDLPA